MRTPVAVTLAGKLVRLEPFDRERHASGLLEECEPEVFAITGTDPYTTGWDAYFDQASSDEGQVVFTQVEAATDRPVGMTRLFRFSTETAMVEIGWTWLARRMWRTGFNREAKWLLLNHVFDDLGAVRVELRTDIRNTRSQTAIEALGGVREGVLRKERRRPDGSWRDTVVYAITDDDWPAVAARFRPT